MSCGYFFGARASLSIETSETALRYKGYLDTWRGNMELIRRGHDFRDIVAYIHLGIRNQNTKKTYFHNKLSTSDLLKAKIRRGTTIPTIDTTQDSEQQKTTTFYHNQYTSNFIQSSIDNDCRLGEPVASRFERSSHQITHQ